MYGEQLWLRSPGAVQVSVVQCKFVLRMLSYSNFSKHLSAVRETNALVKRALDLSTSDQGAAMEHVKQWLQQHNIVGQLLRANLHQKQYVEQVCILDVPFERWVSLQCSC